MEWDQASASWRTVGGRATPAARSARLAAGRGAERRIKRLPSLFDLGFGQRVEVGENIGPGTVVSGVAVGGRLGGIGDAVLQLLFQHEGEEAARDVAANGLVEFVKDRPRGEQALGRAERALHPP